MGIIAKAHQPPPSGWQAELTLGFSLSHQGKTRLRERRHQGPLQVQRPFYPEPNGTCHLYILHPPGGVVGGDSLTLEARLDTGAQALLTTPAAGKFYRSHEAVARQRQRFQISDRAILEWLPQENIVFDGARADTLTRVELQGDAGFLGWEILCLGRPASGETFSAGHCRQGFEVWRDGLPLYLEHGRYEGGSELLKAAWGLQNRPVTATLLCASQHPELARQVRSNLNDVHGDDRLSISHLEGILVCRYLGDSAERARQLFIRIWILLRSAIFHKPACLPRIWHT